MPRTPRSKEKKEEKEETRGIPDPTGEYRSRIMIIYVDQMVCILSSKNIFIITLTRNVLELLSLAANSMHVRK